MRDKKYLALNRTRNTCLASETELARSVCGRMKGLIGRSPTVFSPGRGLWIVPSNGIHTFGLSFPIDVAYLDSGNRILRLYHQLAPFRFAALVLSTRSVLELPAGTLVRTHTEVGDVIEFLCTDKARDENFCARLCNVVQHLC